MWGADVCHEPAKGARDMGLVTAFGKVSHRKTPRISGTGECAGHLRAEKRLPRWGSVGMPMGAIARASGAYLLGDLNILASNSSPGTASSPVLAPELTDKIIAHLDDVPTLRACSLVCRAWVPASRRKNYAYLDINIQQHNIPSFLDLIASPTNTIAGAVKTIKIFRCDDGRASALIARLPDFPCLETIILEGYPFSHQFPALPRVTSLSLWMYMFPAFPQFIGGIIPQFPGLKSLDLGREGHVYAASDAYALAASPRLELDELIIPAKFFDDTHFRDWLASEFSTVARSLVVRLDTSYLNPPTTKAIAVFLRHQGAYLKHLHLSLTGPQLSPSFMEALDLISNNALRTIRIAGLILFLRSSSEPDNWSLVVSPLLDNLLRNCHSDDLRRLTIIVSCLSTPPPLPSSHPVANFAASFELPVYSRLERLQFDGLANGELAFAEVFTSMVLKHLPLPVARVAVLGRRSLGGNSTTSPIYVDSANLQSRGFSRSY
ncbi:hypothetical protein B0H10DRAFT_1950203 [Mycena sp. CBHHK59/15]|nr:hypothetical protein B0H10DRAFT_1950203 [Mycena sp. CBHHK59/15]